MTSGRRRGLEHIVTGAPAGWQAALRARARDNLDAPEQTPKRDGLCCRECTDPYHSFAFPETSCCDLDCVDDVSQASDQGRAGERGHAHVTAEQGIAAPRAGKQVNTHAAAALATLSGLPHLHTLDLASSSSQYLPTFRDLQRCSAPQARRRAPLPLVPWRYVAHS